MKRISKEITHSKPTIERDDIRIMEATLKSRMIARGRKVTEFEREFCTYIGGSRAIATSTGRGALILALKTLGIGGNDEVILPTYTCKSVMDAVTFMGAKPVIVDIGDDYCVSPAAVKKSISDRTKAIIVVHIFGISARIKEISEIAADRRILVIEDCAQAVGGDINGQRLGSFGDLSFFSFQATKVMTCGEGGMLLINNEKLLEDFKKITDNANTFFSMSDIQAALGMNQLNKLSEFIEKRRLLARRYMAILKDFPSACIPIKDIKKSIFFRFPVRIKKDFIFLLLRKKMEGRGIHIRKGVDLMLHQIRKEASCPNADLIFKETVSLPIYPALHPYDVETVVKKLAREI